VKAPGRLVTAEEFDNIIIRQTSGGGELRLKDVGRAELGSENYRSFGRAIVKDSTGNWTGGAAASLLVYLLPGANQLASAEGVYHSLEEFATFFPSDVAYKIVYDTTPSVEASIESIIHTLIEAFILVSIVVFVFLQSFRATIIPAAHRAGGTRRDVHLLPVARLLDQHAHDVRPRAGDRHRGG
jgi:multidrug efflux pump subunit AcrB